MKVLSVIPQEVYKMPIHTKIPKRWAYFMEINSYLKQHGVDIKAMDCLSPYTSHSEVLTELATNQYDVLIILLRTDGIRNGLELSRVAKELSPNTKIIVYGDIPNMAPNFFLKENYGLDGVLIHGDWELGLHSFIEYAAGKKEVKDLKGLSVKENGQWHTMPKGENLKENNWVFANFEDENICPPEIFSIYNKITNKELTITTGRGCPFDCAFCPAVVTFGEKVRNCDYVKLVKFIKKNKDKFNSFKLFNPTFTIDKKWVLAFCEEMIKQDAVHPWCCTSRIKCLRDEAIIEAMAKAGCTKVAIGVETLDEESCKSLGKSKKLNNYAEEVKKVFKTLTKYGIEAKPLMMLGIKGQSKENLQEGFNILYNHGAKAIRCASFSPKEIIKTKDDDGTLTMEVIEMYDKMTYQDCNVEGMTRDEYLTLVYKHNKKENEHDK